MEATPENIILGNKAVMIHALLEEVQSLMDDLENTSVYQKDVKHYAKRLAVAIEKRLNTWYDVNMKNETTQYKYQDTSKDVNATMRALFNSNPAVFKIVPSFIDALKKGKVETFVEEESQPEPVC